VLLNQQIHTTDRNKLCEKGIPRAKTHENEGTERKGTGVPFLVEVRGGAEMVATPGKKGGKKLKKQKKGGYGTEHHQGREKVCSLWQHVVRWTITKTGQIK